ncbi:MAG: DUF1232 domain-containing protein [Rhizobiales bacterium]|nr:DUF1232 domain-containing protein [Hyphomicrobiales bacterium]
MALGHTTGWQDDVSATATSRRAERIVRGGFWQKFRRFAARLPFAEDLLTAYYCAFDNMTPLRVRAVLLGALAYFVLPFDFVPDMLPALGFTDDAAVLATAVKIVMDHVRPEHRDAAKHALERL